LKTRSKYWNINYLLQCFFPLRVKLFRNDFKAYRGTTVLQNFWHASVAPDKKPIDYH